MKWLVYPLTAAPPIRYPDTQSRLVGGQMQFNQLRRREFITLLGSAATWPFVSRAQQQAMPVIGFLYSYSLDQFGRPLLTAFRQGLKESGYEEGRNVAIEYHFAEYEYQRLIELAAELVRRRVAVIVAAGNPSGPIAKSATSTIPVVFATGDDPVKIGLVGSISRPGGNLTGVTTLNAEVGPKRLELLHELVPRAGAIAFLINPSSPGADILAREMPAAARTSELRSTSCMPAANGISTRSSRGWRNWVQGRC